MKKGEIKYYIKYNNEIIIKNFVIFNGDSFVFVIKIPKILLDINFNLYDDNNSLILKKNIHNGITDLGNNQYKIVIDAIDTNLLYKNEYYYNVSLITSNGSQTILMGSFLVNMSTISLNKFVKEINPAIDLSLFANQSVVTCKFDVQKVKEYAFYKCANLVLTSLPENLKYINRYAFYGCNNITLTSLPENIEYIGDSAFQNCTNLALTSLPEKIKMIELATFNYCTNLALTSLPDNIEYIARIAFSDCTNLALTSLPEKLRTIESYAFRRCINLQSLRFKAPVLAIAGNAFQGCINLRDIYVPWSEGQVLNAPWGATNATIHYNS